MKKYYLLSITCLLLSKAVKLMGSASLYLPPAPVPVSVSPSIPIANSPKKAANKNLITKLINLDEDDKEFKEDELEIIRKNPTSLEDVGDLDFEDLFEDSEKGSLFEDTASKSFSEDTKTTITLKIEFPSMPKETAKEAEEVHITFPRPWTPVTADNSFSIIANYFSLSSIFLPNIKRVKVIGDYKGTQNQRTLFLAVLALGRFDTLVEECKKEMIAEALFDEALYKELTVCLRAICDETGI